MTTHLRADPQLSPTEIAQALRACEVLGQWTDEALLALARISTVIRCRRGTLLHRHGQPHSSFYVLLEGAVEYSRLLPDGRCHVMPYIGPGQLIGIAALLGNQPHLFDVRTRMDTLLLRCEGEALRSYLVARPELLLDIAAALSRRYSRLFAQMEVLSMMSLRQRLARVLLELLASFGRADGEGWGVEIALRVAQDDLAAMTAASRQRVNVELRELASEGVLAVRYAKITVNDVPRLREMSGRISSERDA